MADNDDRASLQKLDKKLRDAQKGQRAHLPEDRTRAPKTGVGLAMRMGLELVIGMVAGGGIGWLVDQWLGTLPWFLLLLFLLGTAAGMMNVFRTAKEIGRAADREDDN